MKQAKASTAEPVRILCAANAAYAVPLCVMLVSVVVNLVQDRQIEIYVLATNVPDQDRRKIEDSLCRNRPGFDLGSLHWLSPNMDILKGLYLSAWVDLEVYARLLAPSVLPEDIDKVLYLDCDMAVLSDISELYDSNCEGHSLLAARDQSIGFVSRSNGVFNYVELGIPPQTLFFNSGVLLINLKYWREHDVAGRTIDYLRQHQASVCCWDQGGLNAILYDSWTEIDPAWNQTHGILSPELWKKIGYSAVDWRRTFRHPKIVHYTNADKPWINDKSPRYSHFFEYLGKTSYRADFKEPRLERIIGIRLNFFLWRLKNLPIRLWKDLKDLLRPFLKPQTLPKKSASIQ